jgi:hypothetical protein
MTSSKPIELGTVSEQTKTKGMGPGDNPLIPFVQAGT